MILETYTLQAQIILDLVDRFAEDRKVKGLRPRPVGPLTFELVAEVVGGQRHDLAKPLDLLMVENRSGYYLFFGDILTPEESPGEPPAEERRRRTQLTDGTYVLRAHSRLYQETELAGIVVPHPRGAAPYGYRLEPGAEYPFPRESILGKGLGPTLLRSCLKEADGSGRIGAEVAVVGQSNTYVTDRSGQWVLVFPDTQPDGPVVVRFRLPQPGGGFNNVDVQNVPVKPGHSLSFQQPALEGQTLTQEGTPIPQVAIRVPGRPGIARSSSDGGWRYYFPVSLFPNNQGATQVDVEARHPDGSILLEQNVAVAAGQTNPVPTFRF